MSTAFTIIPGATGSIAFSKGVFQITQVELKGGNNLAMVAGYGTTGVTNDNEEYTALLKRNGAKFTGYMTKGTQPSGGASTIPLIDDGSVGTITINFDEPADTIVYQDNIVVGAVDLVGQKAGLNVLTIETGHAVGTTPPSITGFPFA